LIDASAHPPVLNRRRSISMKMPLRFNAIGSGSPQRPSLVFWISETDRAGAEDDNAAGIGYVESIEH